MLGGAEERGLGTGHQPGSWHCNPCAPGSLPLSQPRGTSGRTSAGSGELQHTHIPHGVPLPPAASLTSLEVDEECGRGLLLHTVVSNWVQILVIQVTTEPYILAGSGPRAINTFKNGEEEMNSLIGRPEKMWLKFLALLVFERVRSTYNRIFSVGDILLVHFSVPFKSASSERALTMDNRISQLCQTGGFILTLCRRFSKFLLPKREQASWANLFACQFKDYNSSECYGSVHLSNWNIDKATSRTDSVAKKNLQ